MQEYWSSCYRGKGNKTENTITNPKQSVFKTQAVERAAVFCVCNHPLYDSDISFTEIIRLDEHMLRNPGMFTSKVLFKLHGCISSICALGHRQKTHRCCSGSKAPWDPGLVLTHMRTAAICLITRLLRGAPSRSTCSQACFLLSPGSPVVNSGWSSTAFGLTYGLCRLLREGIIHPEQLLEVYRFMQLLR